MEFKKKNFYDSYNRNHQYIDFSKLYYNIAKTNVGGKDHYKLVNGERPDEEIWYFKDELKRKIENKEIEVLNLQVSANGKLVYKNPSHYAETEDEKVNYNEIYQNVKEETEVEFLSGVISEIHRRRSIITQTIDELDPSFKSTGCFLMYRYIVESKYNSNKCHLSIGEDVTGLYVYSMEKNEYVVRGVKKVIGYGQKNYMDYSEAERVVISWIERELGIKELEKEELVIYFCNIERNRLFKNKIRPMSVGIYGNKDKISRLLNELDSNELIKEKKQSENSAEIILNYKRGDFDAVMCVFKNYTDVIEVAKNDPNLIYGDIFKRVGTNEALYWTELNKYLKTGKSKIELNFVLNTNGMEVD